jgi:23S rRNA (adenine2030-N6)-methyltransferase
MNYRHAYHAGNFADVHKHVALTAILLHLRKKAKPFVVIDTHAGRGVYDVSSTEAMKTGEAADGIARLAAHAAQTTALAAYLEIVRVAGIGQYPGSPLIAAKLLREQDRLVAVEQQPEEFASLRDCLDAIPNARAMQGDGYFELGALLPPPERRGLVLIDPAYEDVNEMERMAQTFRDAYRRFATGTYVLWYPLKLASRIDALAGELKTFGPIKLLSLGIDAGVGVGTSADRLSAAGLLVINPPFGLDGEMRDASTEILPLLRRGPSANIWVEWLAGAP